MPPVAAECERGLIVEPAVACSITGAAWNRCIVRTGRTASRDAISKATGPGREGVKIATPASDHAFGRDGIPAFRETPAGTPAGSCTRTTPQRHHRVHRPRRTNRQRDEGRRGREDAFVIRPGGGDPTGRFRAADPDRFGIALATGGNSLAAMAACKDFAGLAGATHLCDETPQNPVKDWPVQEHLARFGTPPDFFTAGGMAAGIAAVAPFRSAGTSDTAAQIATMDGMTFETPGGTMIFRAEDHQALQAMCHFRIGVAPKVARAIADLIRGIGIDDMPVPVRNTR
jgi:branched-chain amino acid transport system substrate-binding protein